MSPQTKNVLWGLAAPAALVAATVAVATVLVTNLDIGPTTASFCGASWVAIGLGLYGECYQRLSVAI